MAINLSLGEAIIPFRHGQLGLSSDKMSFFLHNQNKLHRVGGTIRWKKGTEGAGQIFALLRDAGLSNGASIATQGASKLLLGLSGIGAVASVANLAVSAVGFYVMNKKLNKLTAEMAKTQTMISHGFDQMETRFVQVQQMLIHLNEGQQVTWQMLEQTHGAIEEVKDILDASESAVLPTVLDFMVEAETGKRELSDRRIETIEEQTRKLRHRNKQIVERWCLGQKAVDSPAFARGTGYLQEWALALIIEARLLRTTDRTGDAVTLLQRELSGWYYPTATRIADHLLGDHSGVLLTSPFEGRVSAQHYVELEAFRRNEDLSVQDEELYLVEADEVQSQYFGVTPRERRKALRAFDPRPEYARAAQAYNLMELGHRMGSLASEYDICAREGLTMNDWENASLPAEEDEVVLIFAE